MIHFIEPYLQKKVVLAKNIYLYGANLPNEVILDLEMSKSTYQKYQSEINELFLAEKPVNGTFYSVDSLQKIIKNIVSESTQIEILKLFFTDPGHKANYYKEKLLISDATFSRNIAQLKKNLARYDVFLVSQSGYYLSNRDEWKYTLLVTHLAIFFDWNGDKINELVEKTAGNSFLKQIEAYDFSRFTFENNFYENSFFQLYAKIIFIRRYQCVKKRNETGELLPDTFEEIINFLETKFSISEQNVNKIWYQTLERQFLEKFPKEKVDRLKELLICSSFQIDLFPYKLTHIPARHYLFEQKYSLAFPEKKKEIVIFLEKMSEMLQVELAHRYAIIFHFLVIENLLNPQETDTLSIYVYSDLGVRHTKYLSDSVIFILKTMKKNFLIKEFDKNNKTVFNSHEFLVTNRPLSTVPKRKQILVDDYLSINDQILLKKVFLGILS